MNIDRTRYTTLPSNIKVSSSATIQDLTQAILNLNNTLRTEELKLSTYDVMKITQTVTTSDQFGLAKASLGYNDALIINSLENFTIGAENFKRGDIIYKDNAGDYHTIKALTAGYFKPIAYDKEKHMLTFEYTTSTSTDNVVLEGVDIYKDPGVYHIELEVAANNPIRYEFNAYNLLLDIGGSSKELTVYPIVEVYYEDDDNKKHSLDINYTLELKTGDSNI